jgi:hypothetical protein
MRSTVSSRSAPLDRHAVHGEDHVAGANAGAGRGAAVDRRDHHDAAVLLAHLDSDARVLAARADPNVLELAGVQECRVRVEVRDHAADGRLDEVMVIHPVHVVPLDALDDLGEQPRLFPRQRFRVGLPVRQHGRGERDGQPQHDAEPDGKHSAKQQGLHGRFRAVSSA